MAGLRCRRCDQQGEALERAPLPGPAGERVLGGTCRTCWEAWRGEQVKLINELRLSPARPDHYALLVERMSAFLKLA
jgi:Fe-S cluster biosynthesis and repair protein YggX